jgi:hypothetical protein
MKQLNTYLKIFLIVNLLILHACSDDGNDPTSPTNDNRDDFVGLWSVTEESKIFGLSVYESEIIKNSSIASNIAIDNLYNLGIEVVTQAAVNGNQLSIPQQTITGQVLSGSGQLLDKNTLEFNFTADDGSNIDTVSCTYKRK